MLRMRTCRADGVIWANFHPCLHGAAGQPNYWGLACHHCKTLVQLNRPEESLRREVQLRE